MAGDWLRFALRANPVVCRRDDPSGRTSPIRKHDVIMEALHPLPGAARSEQRSAVIQEQGLAWLAKQRGTAGFKVGGGIAIDGYPQHAI